MTTIHFKTHSRWHWNLSLRWIRDKSCTMGHPESIKFGWAVGRRTQEEMKKLHQNFMIENSNSDKVSHHGYHRFYPWFLAHLQGQDINLLEIGIDRTESLKLWKGYFGKINLHGIDINTKVFYDKEVSLHRVDQSSDAELENFAKNIGINFDVILDDGINQKKITLNRPYLALHVVPGLWRELNNFSSGSISLVLASEKYKEEDYIRNYQEFLNFKK